MTSMDLTCVRSIVVLGIIADSFQVYDIPDALEPEAPMDASVFLNGTQHC